MAERIACIDFSKAPKDFRQVALEPGYPLLDRTNANARIVSKWLGRLAAEPERRGDVVSWYVRSEQGARLDGVAVCPITAKDLKGGLKSELKELQKRLDAAAPRTRAEQAVHRTLKDNLAALTENSGRSDLDSSFFKYQDEQGKWRLLWMWGFERTDPSSADVPAALCVKHDCRTLFLNSAETKGKCPHCKTALPIPPNPVKRLAVALVLLLMMAGAGFGGWWFMQPRAVLKGVVLWAGNNQPVAGAEIRIPRLDLTTKTDAAGQFQLLRLPEGPAEIQIAAVGYHPKTQTETLTVGEETSLKIPLDGNASLTGRIINGMGEKVPVEDAVIQVVGTDLQEKSNHKGEFRIEGLPGGGRQIHVSAAGFPEKDLDVKLTAEKAETVTLELIGEAILAGQILQANNEKPISGAKAEVIGTGQSAEADADGWFVIKNLPAGKGELEVTAEGFATHRGDILLAEGKERSERVLLLGAGILTGTVLSASDNKPIPGATVQIEGTRLSAQTDPSGRFSLPGIPSGTVRVKVSAAGYLTAKLDRALQTGKQTNVEVKLEGGAVLAGVVTDGTTNRPLPNAQVEVEAYPNPLRTDDAGAFKIEGVKAGSAKITVKANGLKTETVTKTLKSGEETQVEIQLVGDAKLAGTLSDGLTGHPIADAEIQILDTVLKGKTDDGGKFEINGPKSGSAKIEVAATGYPSQTFSQKLDSGRTTSAAWELSGNAVLTGIVTDPAKNNAPVPEAVATIAGTKISAKSDAKGQFRLEKLPALPIKFDITAAGYKPQTVSQTLSPSKPNEVKVLLGGDAVLVGRVYDEITGQPIPGATIGLEGFNLSAVTDAEGKFRLENAFAGEHTVNASAKAYPTKSQAVTLKSLTPGQKPVEVSIGLSGTAVATGKVVSPDGSPIEGAAVKLAGTKHQANTDETGTYELKKLPGQKVSLDIFAANYKTETVAANLKTGKTTTIPATQLTSGLNVAGEIINALNEKSVSGAKLKIEGSRIEAVSDAEGRFQLNAVPVNPFTLNVEGDGFYPETLEVDPTTGGRDIKPVLAPILKPGEIRIVLLWGQNIPDLDLHLYITEKNGKKIHVWHKNRKTPTATLDVDNRNGYGPETITIKNPNPGDYLIVAHAYQDPKNQNPLKISESAAEVRVYQAGKKKGDQIRASDKPGENGSQNPLGADHPVWYVGRITVTGNGDAKLEFYGRYNYKDDLPD